MESLYFLLIGGTVGWLGHAFEKDPGRSLIWTILAGVVGAMVFGYLAQLIEIDAAGGVIVSLLVATGGGFVGLMTVRSLYE